MQLILQYIAFIFAFFNILFFGVLVLILLVTAILFIANIPIILLAGTIKAIEYCKGKIRKKGI